MEGLCDNQIMHITEHIRLTNKATNQKASNSEILTVSKQLQRNSVVVILQSVSPNRRGEYGINIVLFKHVPVK